MIEKSEKTGMLKVVFALVIILVLIVFVIILVVSGFADRFINYASESVNQIIP